MQTIKHTLEVVLLLVALVAASCWPLAVFDFEPVVGSNSDAYLMMGFMVYAALASLAVVAAYIKVLDR